MTPGSPGILSESAKRVNCGAEEGVNLWFWGVFDDAFSSQGLVPDAGHDYLVCYGLDTIPQIRHPYSDGQAGELWLFEGC